MFLLSCILHINIFIMKKQRRCMFWIFDLHLFIQAQTTYCGWLIGRISVHIKYNTFSSHVAPQDPEQVQTWTPAGTFHSHSHLSSIVSWHTCDRNTHLRAQTAALRSDVMQTKNWIDASWCVHERRLLKEDRWARSERWDDGVAASSCEQKPNPGRPGLPCSSSWTCSGGALQLGARCWRRQQKLLSVRTESVSAAAQRAAGLVPAAGRRRQRRDLRWMHSSRAHH